MKLLKILLILPLLILVIASCTKVIDLNVADESGNLVVEANVTNATGRQTIKLTQNVSLSSTNTYPPVTGANVSVTDQAGNTYQFTEGPAGNYTIARMTGVTGNTYTMHITVNGKTYTATSVMPARVALDSVTAAKSLISNDILRRRITAHYVDPKGIANQYRFIMYVNGFEVNNIYTTNDQFTDGNNVSYDLRSGDLDIFVGDTVKVEMQCVDKSMYTYWYSLMQQGDNGGGVTPSNPPGNITPECLGYFSAHTTQSKTIIVK